MKSNKISIANLNPIFTAPLQKFDKLHREMLGTQAIVTSVDTGKHWGSIKKEDRPYGWQVMTEARVRQFSDSKHYDIPCNALDFRRRCPEGKLTYYDDLTESQQRLFMEKIYECFPDSIFDITFSRLCIHCEYDPKRSNGTPKRKFKERAKHVFPKLKDAILLKKHRKKSGFKRKLGGVILLVGGLLSLIPQTTPIGQGLLAIGGAVGITGAGHGMVKNRNKAESTKIDTIAILRILADILIWLFSRKKGAK